MKSYDEITANVLEATRQHRRKVKQIQYTASVSALCITCILGLGVYMNLEKPEARLPSTEETYTETVLQTINSTEPATTDTSSQMQYQITEFSDDLFLPGLSGNIPDSYFATSTLPPETDPIETETTVETQTSIAQTSVTETTSPPQNSDIPEASKTTPKSTNTIFTTHQPSNTEASLTTAVPLTTEAPLSTDPPFTTEVPLSTASPFTTEVPLSTASPFTTVLFTSNNPFTTESVQEPTTDTTDTSPETSFLTSVIETETKTETTTITISEGTTPPETMPPQGLPPYSNLSKSFTDFIVTNLTEEELEQFKLFIEEDDLTAALHYLAEVLSSLPTS